MMRGLVIDDMIYPTNTAVFVFLSCSSTLHGVKRCWIRMSWHDQCSAQLYDDPVLGDATQNRSICYEQYIKEATSKDKERSKQSN